VTVFNRGRSNPALFKDRGVETLIGDRDPNEGAGLTALEGRQWDAVYDTTSYIKRTAVAAADLLKDNVGRFVMISSVSAYADQAKQGLTEDDEPDTIDTPDMEEITGESYGPLKVICEQTYQEAFGDGATIIRPGYIVGPNDYMMNRFPLWCARIKKGGNLIAPGDPTDPVQLIDARDIADFALRCIENSIGGVYNAVGPASRLSIAEMCYGMRATTSEPIDFTWIDGAFLMEKGIFMIPYLPPDEPTYGGLGAVSNARANAAGMRYRTLARTTIDTTKWMETLDAEQMKPITDLFEQGLEQQLLEEWAAQTEAG
jgi:2'-hydroxyisoflavone reductase